MVGGRQLSWHRSSVFGVPIAALIAIWGAFSAVIIGGKNPTIAVVLLIAALTVTGFVLVLWVYCFKVKPDLLRSDKIQAIQVALESGIFGDSVKGTFKASDAHAQGRSILLSPRQQFGAPGASPSDGSATNSDGRALPPSPEKQE